MGPKKAKGKKGKKGPVAPEQTTTQQIILDRSKMLCPRMGDVYFKTIEVESILTDCVEKIVFKAADRGYSILHLSGMKMSIMPDLSSVISQLQSLTDINLSKNLLFNAQQLFEALVGIEGLKRLNVSQNFLNGILPEIAGQCKNLESLNLDINQLTGLSPGCVNQWASMKHFSIADNSLICLPEELSTWKNIEIINVKNNKIPEIPVSIFTNCSSSLQRLYIGYNLLTVIPEEIGECTKLQSLDFAANQITVLPTTLSKCADLELLHLGNNKLVEIPPEIFASLTKLKELQLYKNKLAIVPPEIGNLQAVERMSLASNNIKALPEELGSCTSLQELYLGNNAKLSSFPNSAGHLHMLRELSLRKCPALKQLPNTAAEMVSLRELDVRAMKKEVCKIAEEVFVSLEKQNCVVRGGVIKKGKPSKKG